MRTVLMNHRPIPPDEARARLLRHLLGRMQELEEDGLRVEGPSDPFAFHGPLVSVSFSGRDNREMVRRLEEAYRIFVSRAQPGPGDASSGPILLCPAPGVTFEDIDYVHGAVYRLLLENC